MESLSEGISGAKVELEQDVVRESLLVKEHLVLLQVVFTRENPREVASSLELLVALVNHGVVLPVEFLVGAGEGVLVRLGQEGLLQDVPVAGHCGVCLNVEVFLMISICLCINCLFFLNSYQIKQVYQ